MAATDGHPRAQDDLIKTLHSTVNGLILYSRHVYTINPCNNCPVKIIQTMSAQQRMCDPYSLIAANHHH